jgi:hypothetical protein
MIQCIGARFARARTGVLDGLTLHTKTYEWITDETLSFTALEMKGKSVKSNLIGSEPKTTPLQLSAAIALSAWKNEAKNSSDSQKND